MRIETPASFEEQQAQEAERLQNRVAGLRGCVLLPLLLPFALAAWFYGIGLMCATFAAARAALGI